MKGYIYERACPIGMLLSMDKIVSSTPLGQKKVTPMDYTELDYNLEAN